MPAGMDTPVPVAAPAAALPSAAVIAAAVSVVVVAKVVVAKVAVAAKVATDQNRTYPPSLASRLPYIER